MNLDYKYIEDLLHLYWKGETSIEEEQILCSFFSGNDVPEHLMKYKKWFAYKQELNKACLSDDFEDKILKQISLTKVDVKRITLWQRFKPLFKGIAAVLLLCFVGNSMRDSITSVEPGVAKPTEETIETGYDSSVAFSGNDTSVKKDKLVDSVTVTGKDGVEFNE